MVKKYKFYWILVSHFNFVGITMVVNYLVEIWFVCLGCEVDYGKCTFVRC